MKKLIYVISFALISLSQNAKADCPAGTTPSTWGQALCSAVGNAPNCSPVAANACNYPTSNGSVIVDAYFTNPSDFYSALSWWHLGWCPGDAVVLAPQLVPGTNYYQGQFLMGCLTSSSSNSYLALSSNLAPSSNYVQIGTNPAGVPILQNFYQEGTFGPATQKY